MDPFLIRMFQMQIKFQCDAVLLASESIRRGLKEGNTAVIFSGIQNLLGAAANISKACWAQKGNLSAQRLPLRKSIGITDDSPLRDTDIRNNWDHFDDRLDTWWRDSSLHNYSDLNFESISGFDDIDTFRALDPKTLDVFFWGDRFNLQLIVREVERISP